MPQQKIPTTIITGFLGSGKTSLLTHLLRNSGGRRIAVLINEFGSLGMDEAIVKSKCDDDCKPTEVIELANGCICCTVADDFLPAMKKILDSDKPIDHIIIETSGLALPKPLLQAFQWHEIAPRVTVDGVVAVLDGPAIVSGKFQETAPANSANNPPQKIDHENEVAELFEDQLLSADLVLLNKCDLLSSDERKKIIDDLRSGKLEGLRAEAKIIETENGTANPALILGIGQAVENDLENRKSHHDGEGMEEHGHDEFATFIVSFGTVRDEKKLEQVIASLLAEHDILRIKGMVAHTDKNFLEIWQIAGPRIERYFSMTKKEKDMSQLVVIGLMGIDQQAIETALQAAAA